MAELSTREDNFQLYKLTAAMLWAQINFGTFRLSRESWPGEESPLFDSMETLRLEVCIGRELPGIYRMLGRVKSLSGQDSLSDGWSPVLPVRVALSGITGLGSGGCQQ